MASVAGGMGLSYSSLILILGPDQDEHQPAGCWQFLPGTARSGGVGLGGQEDAFVPRFREGPWGRTGGGPRGIPLNNWGLPLREAARLVGVRASAGEMWEVSQAPWL